MSLPLPDYRTVKAARARLPRAALGSLVFVALICMVQYLNWGLDLELERFGVRPREWPGLAGILVAPLIHAGFAHLASNAIPVLVVGTLMLDLYPDSSRWVLPAVYLGPGILVWLFARDGVHVGASGLVYGLVSYIFVAGLLRRDRRAIAAALLVSFLYGALVWGILPLQRKVSWESHLAAALIGVWLAFALRRIDRPPRVHYSWEDEVADLADGPSDGGSDGR